MASTSTAVRATGRWSHARRSPSSARSPARSTRPTRAASSTATSSRVTSCSTGPVQGEHAYLTDFGLTKQTRHRVRADTMGPFMGTPGYMAPEQIEGQEVDGRVDLYSLGCIAFELLTGACPSAATGVRRRHGPRARLATGAGQPSSGSFLRPSTRPRPGMAKDAGRDIRPARPSSRTCGRRPTVQVLSPGAQYWELLRTAIVDGSARGNLVFDATRSWPSAASTARIPS